jgi:hypothetical protein
MGRTLVRTGESLVHAGRTLVRMCESVVHAGESLVRMCESLVRAWQSLVGLGESLVQAGQSLVHAGESLVRPGELDRGDLRVLPGSWADPFACMPRGSYTPGDPRRQAGTAPSMQIYLCVGVARRYRCLARRVEQTRQPSISGHTNLLML